jgi:hypothetical protein
VLLLLWSWGCTLAALASATLSNGDGPLLVGVAAIVAAQAAVVGGRAAGLSPWAVWALALAFTAVGALGRHGPSLLLYLGLVAALLVVADRFAVLAIAFSGLSLPGAEDPIARELARARRYESRLAVASISAARSRGASRRLAHVARALIPSLRTTDAIVRAIADRLVVVLPGGDDEIAIAVLRRALAEADGDLRIGTATFPRDGPTWAALKEAARERERPWSASA